MVPAIATLVSTLIAALMAASAPALLRWPPAPEDEPGGIFSDLGTRRFRLVLAGVCLASGVATLATTAPVLWPAWAPSSPSARCSGSSTRTRRSCRFG